MAKVTARDLISGALRLLGVYQSGENITAHEAKDGLLSLNDMLESWSLERLMISIKTRETFDLIAGQAKYTFGPLGDFNSLRPTRIEYATYLIDGLEQGLEILQSDDEWSGLSQKTQTSTQPTQIYLEAATPLANLYVWPVPSGAGKIVLTSWKPLAKFSDVNAEIDLPEGYSLALRSNLAIHLAPEYAKSVSGELLTMAESSKSRIKAINIKPEYFVCDAPGVRRGSMNIFTGEFD